VTIYTVYWPLTIGLVILAIVIFAPGGLLGLAKEWLVAWSKERPPAADQPAAPETGRGQ
jgi:hypothetical protein